MNSANADGLAGAEPLAGTMPIMERVRVCEAHSR
jgi:hypothetical protein